MSTAAFYFDLETSGLNQYHNEIIEIGIVALDCKHHTSILIKPSKPIEKKITDITGITNKMLDDEGVSVDDAMKQFHEFISTHSKSKDNIWLIGHNVIGFDKPFYYSTLERNQIKPYSKPIYWLDTLPLSKILMPQMFSFKLISLCKYLRLKDTQTHRAIGDCSLVALLLPSLLKQLFIKYPHTKANTSKHHLFEMINTLLHV